MPIKYVPFIPEPVEGQAVLGNFNRVLKYKGTWLSVESVSPPAPI